MLKRLHLSLRFIVPLFVAMLALAYAAVPLVDTLTLRWFVRDLDGRSFLIGETLGESLIEHVRNNQWPRVDALLDRAIRDERIYAVASVAAGPAAAPGRAASADHRLQRRRAHAGHPERGAHTSHRPGAPERHRAARADGVSARC